MNAVSCSSNTICWLAKRLQIKPCPLGITQVRFRKPRVVPIAPSKYYRVRVPTLRDREETAIQDEKWPVYKTAVLSVNAKIKGMVEARGGTTSSSVTKIEPDEETLVSQELEPEFIEKLKINENWNQEIALEREERLKHQAELQEERRDRKMSMKLDKLERRQAEAAKILSRRPERNLAALSESDLDLELDKILDTPPANYEYAIES